MQKHRFLFACAVALLLTGCQTVEPPATASGKPEVTIKAQTAAIKARLLSLAMDRRFNVTKDTEYLLQIEKPSDNLGATILLGSKYDSTPAERIVFTFAPLGDSVRVVASSMFVTNPGSSSACHRTGPGCERSQAVAGIDGRHPVNP
jgi:hypothetical protein